MDNDFSPRLRAEQLQNQKLAAEARRKKRARRRITLLLCGCAAIALLAVGSRLLTGYQERKQAQEDAKNTPQISVASLPASGRADSLTFTDTDGVQRSFAQDAAGGWHWSEDSELPLDGQKLDAMLQAAAQLKAFMQFAPQPGQQYGLQQPRQQIVLADSLSGEAVTLYLGAVNPVSEQLYLSSSGDDTVLYSVDQALLDSFDCSLYDLMLPETVPLPEGSSKITGFSVQSPQTEKLKFELWEDAAGVDLTGSSRWSVTQGDTALPVDSTTATVMLGRLINLQPDTCVAWKPDAAALAGYGLAEDTRTVLELRYTDAGGQAAVTVIYIGGRSPEGSSFYMQASGLDGVYLSDKEKLEGLIGAGAADFASAQPFAVSGNYLTGLTVAREDKELLTLYRTVVEQTEEDGTTKQVTAYTLSGSDLPDEVGSRFVSALAGLTCSDLKPADTLPAEQPALTVNLLLKDRAWPQATVRLYRHSPESYEVYYTRGTAVSDQKLLCARLAAEDWQTALDALTGVQLTAEG